MADPIDVGSVGRPLARKLGLRDGLIVLLVAMPEHLVEPLLDPNYAWSHVASDLDDVSPGMPPLDLALVFCRRSEEVEVALNLLDGAVKRQGIVWIAWSRAPGGGDLVRPSEESIRSGAQAVGLRPLSTLIIDETWAAWKLTRKESSI